MTKDNTKDCIAEVKTVRQTLTKEDNGPPPGNQAHKPRAEVCRPILSVTSQDMISFSKPC